MLLAHDREHLQTQVMYKNSRTDMKGKYLSAGDNPISTALEWVGNLSTPYIKLPQLMLSFCCSGIPLSGIPEHIWYIMAASISGIHGSQYI